MYCFHCKHFSDDVICLPASFGSGPVDEHQKWFTHGFYEESLAEPVSDEQLSVNDAIPQPVVTVPESVELAVEPPAPHEVARVRTRLKTPPGLKYIISIPDKSKLS